MCEAGNREPGRSGLSKVMHLSCTASFRYVGVSSKHIQSPAEVLNPDETRKQKHLLSRRLAPVNELAAAEIAFRLSMTSRATG